MVQELEAKNMMANQMATFFKTRESTLRNFCVFRVFDGYYTRLKLAFGPDMVLKLSFSAHDVDEKCNESLMAIDKKHYDSFIDSYNRHLNLALLRSNESPDDCPKSRRFKLSNPHWRMRKLFKLQPKEA